MTTTTTTIESSLEGKVRRLETAIKLLLEKNDLDWFDVSAHQQTIELEERRYELQAGLNFVEKALEELQKDKFAVQKVKFPGLD